MLLQQKVDYQSRQIKTQLDQLANKNRMVEECREALRRKEKELVETKRRMENLNDNLDEILDFLFEKRDTLKVRES